jgi:hypothetical protein
MLTLAELCADCLCAHMQHMLRRVWTDTAVQLVRLLLLLPLPGAAIIANTAIPYAAAATAATTACYC